MLLGGLLLLAAGTAGVAFAIDRGLVPLERDGEVPAEPVGDAHVDVSEADPAEADAEAEGDPEEANGPGHDEEDQVAERETVALGGECEVEVPLGTDPAEQHAWDHECPYAPVDPARGETWIVVLASLNGQDFDSEDAEARSRESGVGQVLWSSHYASLNPGLWVVYDGPFPSESAAEAAAGEHGGGAYARTLSDDEDDRFCLAEDGCVGERDR